MRVAIINMPVRTHLKPNAVPLGIYHVGAAIKKRRPEDKVTYIDLNLLRPSGGISLVTSLAGVLDYDVFLLSGLITTLDYQIDVTKLIRRDNPMAFIISGGGLATNCPSELLDWLDIDVSFVGEAEYRIVDVLNDIESQAGWRSRIQQGSSPENLDDCLMDWDDVMGLERYICEPIWGTAVGNSSSAPFKMIRSLNLNTSRGCPMACKFCSHEATGGREYRMRSPQSVFDETTRLVQKYKLDFVAYLDDNMLVNSTRNQGIAQRLLALHKQTGFTWGCHARFDFPLNDLPLLAESGCRYIGFGGESANRDILKKMQKRNDPDQMIKVLKACRQYGIHPNVTWMLGWPGETLEQIQDTVRFILGYAPENKRMFVATAYPGTALWSEVKDQILKVYSLRSYVSGLDDATIPFMNFTELRDTDFHRVVKLAAKGELEGILE